MPSINSLGDVSSVSQFVEAIVEKHRSVESYRESDVSCLTFYRGQSNLDWDLSPRLFREGLLEQERALIEEIKRLFPSEFDGLGYFDQLVKMQHYGIPTRLLDTTLNPLVALFFACSEYEESSQDGCVFALPQLPVFRPNNWSVQASMIYTFELSGPYVNLGQAGELLKRIPNIDAKVKSESHAATMLTCIAGWPFTCVLPNLNNRRVIDQDGAFLLCNMEIEGEPIEQGMPDIKKGISFKARNTHKDLEDWKGTFSLNIPAKYKAQIVEELSLIGVSRGRLFPELEHQADFVLQALRKKK